MPTPQGPPARSQAPLTLPLTTAPARAVWAAQKATPTRNRVVSGVAIEIITRGARRIHRWSRQTRRTVTVPAM